MKRRVFLGIATASALLPAALRQGTATLAAASPKWDYVLFDERFERAQRLAASWRAANLLVAVRGDVTALWRGELERIAREHPLHLRGATTESAHFCLRILLSEHANLDTRVSRLDRNLLLWTMRTTAKPR
jgi:hypothetical protein